MIGADSTPGQGGAQFDLSQIAMSLSRNAQNLNTGWFPPSQPLIPLAPADAGWGRRLDYNQSWNLQNVPHGQEMFTYEQLRSLATGCDYINICTQTVIDRLSNISGQVVDVAGDPKRPSKKAVEISKWAERPDGVTSFYDWFGVLIREMLEIDAPTVWIDRRGSTPLAHYIDGASIAVRIDERGAPYMMTQIIKGAPAHDYPLDTMIWCPKNRRSYNVWGFSPVEQIARFVSMALRRTERQLSFFSEGDIPSMLIEAPQNWTPEQIRTMNNSWGQMLAGISGKDKARWMPPGSKATVYDRDPSQGEFDEWLMRVITYNFSLPPTHFVKQVNRSTSETLQDASVAEGHKANLRWSAGFLTSIITAAHGPGFAWKWNLDEDPAAAQTVELVKAGVLKKSALVRIGYDLSDIAEDAPEPKKEDGKKLGDEEKTQKNGRVHEVSNGEIDNADPEFVATVATYLEAMSDEAARAGVTALEAGAVPDVIDSDSFVRSASPHLRSSFSSGVDAGVRAVADGTPRDVVPERAAVEYARERSAWLIGKKVVDGKLVENPNAAYRISNVARDAVRSLVTQANEERWSVQRLAQEIKSAHPFDRARALNIARTETAEAQDAGKLSYMVAAGVKMKRWSDYDACEICKANAAAGAIPIDKAFPSGHSHAPAHPNCRCTVLPA